MTHHRLSYLRRDMKRRLCEHHWIDLTMLRDSRLNRCGQWREEAR